MFLFNFSSASWKLLWPVHILYFFLNKRKANWKIGISQKYSWWNSILELKSILESNKYLKKSEYTNGGNLFNKLRTFDLNSSGRKKSSIFLIYVCVIYCCSHLKDDIHKRISLDKWLKLWKNWRFLIVILSLMKSLNEI